MKNFGEFYNNQVETASTIIMSRTDSVAQQKLDAAVALLREHNAEAAIVTTPWSDLTGKQLRDAMEGKSSLAAAIAELEQEHMHHHDEHCYCHEEHEHHHHDEHCHCHEEHEHHHHDEHCHCHEEHEHHHHDEHCHCHEGHEHHHHHADEVFTSWGTETARKYSLQTVEEALAVLDGGSCGTILRAKGIVAAEDGSWIHFDFVPGERNVRTGAAAVTGKLCVIGSDLKEAEIAKIFGV